MCGVIGVLGPQARVQAEKGLARLAHRGIRSHLEHGPGWAVGHVRLPIVGLGEENDQPVRRRNWVLGFVGEVLDFRSYRPSDQCDLGLVVDTWDKDGPLGFSRFDGFWGIVAYDRGSGNLHALTDYLNQKPLYVRSDKYATAIANELSAVAWLGPVQLDEVYLSAVCKWGYCPEVWRTPYQSVRKLLAGEHLILGNGGVKEIRVVDRLTPFVLSLKELKIEIERAVEKRVVSSDVPVACLVSGGLDSSITYTLAKRYGSLHPYHVENEEWSQCQLVAPLATRLKLADLAISHSQALDYLQEPIDLGSLFPQIALSKAIAREGKERVCLTGDGADELFGGYSRSSRYDSQTSDVWHELAAWHLPRLDRVMMRNQIEVRSPFLARKVASAAFALPWEERKGKRILRELFKDLLPPEVVTVKKKPLRTWVVETNREAHSCFLVQEFRRMVQEREEWKKCLRLG